MEPLIRPSDPRSHSAGREPSGLGRSGPSPQGDTAQSHLCYRHLLFLLALNLALAACTATPDASEGPSGPEAETLRATIAALPTTDPSLAGGPPPPQGEPGKAVDPIEGPIWIVKSVAAAQLEPLDGAEISARFLAGGINGSAGCNTYAGRFTVEGDRIRIEDIFASEMMCSLPEGVMGMESAYLGALASASQYELEAGWLSLSDAGGAVLLRFQAAGEN